MVVEEKRQYRTRRARISCATEGAGVAQFLRLNFPALPGVEMHKSHKMHSIAQRPAEDQSVKLRFSSLSPILTPCVFFSASSS